MEPDATRLIARRLRAARHYAGKSRLQIGQAVGRSAEQIGRYERGDWKTDPPGKTIIEGIARETLVPLWFIYEGFGIEEDPAKRFEAKTRLEAERQRERHAPETAARPGEDATDGGR